MTIETRLRAATLDEKPVIAALLRPYLAELGPCGYGEENYPFLDAYWRKEKHWPHVVDAGGSIAGFVLANAESITGYAVDATIAEFYIIPRFRRAGCGEQAAAAAFRARPGRWELSFHRDNVAAREFWPRVAERRGRSIEFFDIGERRIMRFRTK